MSRGSALLAVVALGCADLEVGPELAKRAADACRLHSADPPAEAFTTDACSAWPDGDYGECCIEHDVTYWCGGTAAERSLADEELQACVAKKKSAAFAWAMWTGVRIGGHPALPLPWRWGYGRDWPTLYTTPD